MVHFGEKFLKNEKSLCVYCGSSPGAFEEYAAAARELGRVLAKRSITLVYGGAGIGIMGILADEVLANGGEVIGVMPTIIGEREVTHTGLTQLIEVADMHQRKAKMMALADAFAALPGGIGTFEELFEALTWLQLGIHKKRCGLINTLDYYQGLQAFLSHGVDQGFVRQSVVDELLVADTAENLIARMFPE
ncbi:TIGR00730 family Rossman fold protein [Halioxenophilus aromaticivorans]|uniref:Cytokinin riboside 5'-monophosphate phosphoribohydrolase n=1 Tax=Halioxenophilus aromaticivorans TaxID=1306992 RepID=A0AAV3TWC7_9ALTE